MKNYIRAATNEVKMKVMVAPAHGLNAQLRINRLRLMRAGLDVSKIHDDDLEIEIIKLDLKERKNMMKKHGVISA